jgi:hypothetical protein
MMAVAKSDLREGMILWLGKAPATDPPQIEGDDHGRTNEHGVLGIERGGCDHPVVVVDLMEENQSRVWICSVRRNYLRSRNFSLTGPPV